MNKDILDSTLVVTRDTLFSNNDLPSAECSVDIHLRALNHAYFAEIHFDDEQDIVLLAEIINEYIAKHIKS